MKESIIKKFAMLHYWRIGQIAPIVNLIMLSITLSLIVYGFMDWRGGLLGNPYIGPTVIWFFLMMAVLFAGYLWDRYKMWHELQVVVQERVPFSYGSKVSAKEVWQYVLVWLPSIEKNDSYGQECARLWKKLLKYNLDNDPMLKKKVEMISKEALDGVKIEKYLEGA